MTDNEIIKVLECCGKEYSCEKCALNTWLDKKRDCIGAILVNALDLINRLQDEKQALINGQETLQNTIVEQKAEIDRLKHRKTELQIRNQELQHEKSEAIKEFIDELKNRVVNKYEYTDIRVFKEIDDLVKEMTKEEKALHKINHNSLCETETYNMGGITNE